MPINIMKSLQLGRSSATKSWDYCDLEAELYFYASSTRKLFSGKDHRGRSVYVNVMMMLLQFIQIFIFLVSDICWNW